MKKIVVDLLAVFFFLSANNLFADKKENLYIFWVCKSSSNKNLNDTSHIESSPSCQKENDQPNQDLDKQGKYWARQIKEDFGKDFDYIEYSPAQLKDIHSRLEWCNWIKNDFGKNFDYKKYSIKQLVDIYNRFQWLEWIKRDFGVDYSQSTYSAYELRILYNGFKRIKYTK